MEKETCENGPGRGKKVLVIDDEPDIVTYLSVLLEDNGFQVECVTDADKAVAEAERFLPDLILLDIMMPKKTGLAIYKMLRSDPRLELIPVIIVSAFSRVKDFPARDFDELVSKAGMPQPAGYIEKPINRKLLIKRALEAVGG